MKSPAKQKFANGFTLIEVAFAILVLAASLITILGLQSSIIARSTHDRNIQRAMLKSREILSALEAVLSSSKGLPNDDIQGRPSEVVATILGSTASKREDDDDARLTARLTIKNWPIPGVTGLPEDLVKRIDVRVEWGSAPAEAFEVTYFVPEEMP